MNILITILIVLVSLIAILMIMALFIKKDDTIKREIIINKPKQEVFNYVTGVTHYCHKDTPTPEKSGVGARGTKAPSFLFIFCLIPMHFLVHSWQNFTAYVFEIDKENLK